MTVTWRLTQEDLEEAVVLYLREKFNVEITKNNVRLRADVYPTQKIISAEATGAVDEGFATGPYR